MYVKPDWFRNRGYLHLSSHKNIHEDGLELLEKIKNPSFVSRHAFFPLIHSIIKERRYKIVDGVSKKRAHSFKNENGIVEKKFKSRPLHYATHIDAMIFGCYAEKLLEKYEKNLLTYPIVSESVIAYCKIPLDESDKNKSTIHFANEVFEEIKRKSQTDNCCVLKFDIKSFFSRIDHNILKGAWGKIISEENLPNDHYNVFKAATRFSYFMKDDFRINQSKSGKRSNFDEKKISGHLKKGIQAFFESPEELREKIKSRQIRIHKYPFRNKDGKPVGIPQGLPISAVLANLYLLDFDIAISEEVVKKFGAYYRRYSDDIIVVCRDVEADEIQNFIHDLIKKSKVEISEEKTEKFSFKKIDGKVNVPRLTSIKNCQDGKKIGIPFTYLGFEFYGYKTLIKSQNLAKFYRRMITSVKSKCKRANDQVENGQSLKPIIYRRQLYKLYTSFPLDRKVIRFTQKRLIKNERGDYRMITIPSNKPQRSNYISYVRRSSEIMKEPAIFNQVRNHMKIFNLAVNKHLNKPRRIL